MCKKSLLMMLLFALLAPWAANAQTTVEIGDGTSAGYYTPIGTYYNYSITEQLYTADEIGMAGTISSVSFYWAYTTAKDFNITMYMANVDAADLSTGISLAEASEVFSGTLSAPAEAGWVTINLDTPFAYDGTSNLLIGFNKTGGASWFSGNTWQYTTATGMARYSQNDSSPYDITSTTPGSATANRPNIQIDITPSSGPTCAKPSTLEVTDITGYGATCTWENTGAASYTFEWKKASDSDYTVVSGLTANTYALSSLESFTAYNVRVKAVCDTDLESGYKTANFTTLDVCPDGLVCIGEGTATNSYLPTYFYYNYSLTEQIYTADEIGTAGAIESVDIYSVGTGTRTLEIYMVSTEKRAFEGGDWIPATASDLVFSGEVTFAANSWNTFEFDNPFIYNGTSNVALIVRDMTGSYVSGIQFFVFEAESQALYAYRDASEYDLAAPGVTGTVLSVKNRVRFAIGEPPACPKPTGVTVEVAGNQAVISWTSDATSFNIDIDGTVIENVTNPYTFTGELATTYEVMVQANCDDATSEWTNPVSFTTDACMPEDQIVVNYALTDSYGDGWNDNYILVVDENCNIVNQLTIESGNSASGTLKVCGSYVQFLWYAGSYPTETSWVFTDNAGNVLFEGAGSADMATLDVLYTIDNNPYQAPVDVAASEVGPHSAKLSWTETGTATAWQIKLTAGDDEEGTIIDANSNPFVITGLTPETEYFAQVRATGANGTSIWTCLGADFTTTVACPKPSNLSVTAYPTSADVAWEGFADAYDLEWALLPASESKDALWLQYDDGTVVTNVGNSTIYEWTWAVMYPADMLQGNNMLSKVAFYETSYYSAGDPITINIYSGGDSEPETLVYTENVTCTGTVGIHEVILSSFVNIDPAQNLWITLTSTTIDRPMAMSAVDEANGRWVDNGSWMDIGTALASVSTYTFMIRGYVEPGFDPSTLEWNPVSGITSPYTLEGLQPETTYVVRVKAICGGEDGESEWTMTTFTTPSACDMPIDLAANDITYNSAKLSWTGYQESYNLRYRRTPYVATTYFSENFDEGLPTTWTTIDNDTTTVGNWIALSEINSVYTYYTSPLTGWAHSGADAVASASYVNGVGSVATDNYLVTPQVTFNGKLRFYATSEYEDPDTYEVLLSTTGNSISDFNVTLQAMGPATYGAWDEVIIDLSDYAGQQGYIAIHHVATDKYWLVIDDFGMYDFVDEDWTNVTATENTYTATGLTPEAEYEWQVQGVNTSCDGGLTEWSEIATFTTPEQTTLTQTIVFSEGEVNYCSFYVDITLADLQTALTDVLGTGSNVSITIKSQTQSCKLTRGRWTGQLTTLDLGKMYKILVNSDCEITLEGMLVDPAEHPVTISGGGNPTWIAFPFNADMTLTDAFAGFAVNGDALKSKTQNANYTRGRWTGQLSTLEPGQGYIYKSASNAEERVFVYPTSAKAKVKAAPIAIQTPKTKVDASMEKKPRTIDIDFPRK